ncbi:glycine zipper 2TM domain-containing protein [Acerihabitans arboris]|uniref:Glycine zipper 2TM domain-containing protein n=1 Tax=Acerihabitans arboris TaxID=2691583 RepID=A0A845SH06_9GAMM|nr:glycine zipper 2TM domain-containing protein [Acerihabitans arboris]NDL62672.1 glycine zipper 2TM domain-containing protein [Acerihabitans arboris]
MIRASIISAIAIAILSGCASNRTSSGDTFTAAQARQVHTVTYGTLISVRPITIQGGTGENAAGSIGGGVIGGFLGNTIGGGSGRSLATAAGAVGGAAAGSGIQSAANRSPGVELEVRRDDGSTIIVAQAQGTSQFFVGQRVAIASGGGRVTVSPR